MREHAPEFDRARVLDALHSASVSDLLHAAHATVDRGIVTPSLAELITRNDRDPDIRDLFADAVRELGKRPMSPDDAEQALIRASVTSIAMRQSQPARSVDQLLRNLPFERRWGLRARARLGGRTSPLYRLINEYADLEIAGLEWGAIGPIWQGDPAAFSEAEARMLALAEQWVAENPVAG